MPLQWALLVAYPVLAILATATASPALAVAAVGALLALVVAPLLRRWPWRVAPLLGIALAVVLATGAQRWSPLVLFLPPVLINLALALFFGHTLRAGDEPLVARIVRLLHPANDIQDAAVWPYARRVTIAWTALFLFNATTCAVLALLAVPGGLLLALGWQPAPALPLAAWALFANAGCYALVGLMFVAEYAYRRRRFPWQPYRNFFHFLQRAASVGPALAAEMKAGSARPAAR